MTEQALQTVEDVPAPVSESAAPITPWAMLDRAIAQGAGMDVLEKLMALQERYDAAQARKAFDHAMAAAKAEMPVIKKNRRVGYEHKDGRGETNYSYEDMGEIARTIDPILGKYGLSYRFRTTQQEGVVTVTCIVSHEKGHSEENSLSAAHDNSGKKNSIQALGSTVQYLQRYTLKPSLGLAASEDDDGKRSDEQEPISDEQRDQILELAADTNASVQSLCAFLKVEAIAHLPANRFDQAIEVLEARKRKQANADH